MNGTLGKSGGRVAEENEGAEAPAPGMDAVALAAALGAASSDKADAFLSEQTRLVRLQADELSHELDPRHWSLWVRHLSGVLKLTLEVSLALFGLGVIGVGAAAVWYAAHSDGLVIESFSVPPDLAQKGQSGQVVATQLLDQINLVENSSQGQSRPGRALSGGWSDDVKVEIPETGISIGELYRFLCRWLGHESRLSGEVVHAPEGLAVTVRIDGANSATYIGSESDLNGLVLKAAEHLVRVTQPARYGTYLVNVDPPRPEEAQAVLEQTAADNLQTPLERSNAYNGLAVLYGRFKADDREANELYRLATKTEPEFAVSYLNRIGSEFNLGHAQASLDLVQPTVDVIRRSSANYYPEAAVAMPAYALQYGASLVGDEAGNDPPGSHRPGAGPHAASGRLPPRHNPSLGASARRRGVAGLAHTATGAARAHDGCRESPVHAAAGPGGAGTMAPSHRRRTGGGKSTGADRSL